MKPFSAMPAYQEIIDVLRSAVSDTGLITDPADISAAALDGRGRRQGEASCDPPRPKRFLSS